MFVTLKNDAINIKNWIENRKNRMIMEEKKEKKEKFVTL